MGHRGEGGQETAWKARLQDEWPCPGLTAQCDMCGGRRTWPALGSGPEGPVRTHTCPWTARTHTPVGKSLSPDSHSMARGPTLGPQKTLALTGLGGFRDPREQG